MKRATLFSFTLPSGKCEQVFFERDFVRDGQISVGSRVLIRCSADKCTFIFGAPEHEAGLSCVLMAISEEVITTPPPRVLVEQDTNVLHLALECASTQIH